MQVLILTEAGLGKGLGHLSRCVSLYDCFKEKGFAPKLIIDSSDSVFELIGEREFEILDWINIKEDTLNIIEKGFIIIDSYIASLEIYKWFEERSVLSVYIDDFNRLNYPKGIVVNGNIFSSKINYLKNDNKIYLLGEKYFLLKKEFSNCGRIAIKKRIKNILITFGGDDSKNMTPIVLKLLQQNFKDIKKTVVIGRSFENLNEIKSIQDNTVELELFPTAKKMKELMQNSDMVISSAGQTLSELAALGVPTIAVAVAENQILNAIIWEEKGFSVYAGFFKEKEISIKILNAINSIWELEKRQERSTIGHALIDGLGADRLVSEIEKIK